MRAPAPRHAPNDGVIERAEDVLGDMLLHSQDKVGEVALFVDRDRLPAALQALRDTPGLEYQQLMEIAGVDYPDRPDRFEIVYMLLSLTRNHRIQVRVATNEDAAVPTVTHLWPVAGWLEREVYDLFGVLFSGNRDLRRILTDYGFRGHPLRKDFPMTGYTEVRYSEEEKRVVQQPVDLPQDFRNFDFLSSWEGAQYSLPGDEKTGEEGGALPQAKGAQTTASPDATRAAGTTETPTAAPKAPDSSYAKGGSGAGQTAHTGAGQPHEGNKPESKPVDPDVIPTEAGQNQ
ncbi:NADH-quinone oxidoreductase subunit C [uncultured Sphingomonas sp.]|uniref:NADH-quinone oxidoreductase subunit C n=1 Tax=uncultured Sphingomonas sp. TaxID=158754 RepID=UPI0035CB24C8